MLTERAHHGAAPHMKFCDLKPGDLFTFRPRLGGRWDDRNLYRKATERTYHRADKILSMFKVSAVSLPVTPESADAVQTVPSGVGEGAALRAARA
jgi:hypothetical protein